MFRFPSREHPNIFAAKVAGKCFCFLLCRWDMDLPGVYSFHHLHEASLQMTWRIRRLAPSGEVDL